MRSKFLFLSVVWVLPFVAPAATPLNFVIFLADDISQEDIGIYGHPTIQIPNIDQLTNLVDHPAHAAVLAAARDLLAAWTTQTGDTIPTHPSPSRDAPPGQPKRDRHLFQRGEIPGDATHASTLNHPGPR